MGCRAGALTDGCERQVATLALIEVPAWLSLYGVPDTKLVLLPRRANATERWDVHKFKQGSGSPASSPLPTSSAGQYSLDSKNSSPSCTACQRDRSDAQRLGHVMCVRRHLNLDELPWMTKTTTKA
uniref:Uncharacterized protein n=1 Tax=Setaria viridis TaxID=4556 RepID=A0A4U6TMQ6_SETVI|nr:hypothetical protein SEVIR_7G072500v2 [Setaria viridis]